MTLPVNKPKLPNDLKGDVLAIRRLLLDDTGKQLNADASTLLKHLMGMAGMMATSDMLPQDKYEIYIGRRDIVVAILDIAFDDLTYYDDLIRLTIED